MGETGRKAGRKNEATATTGQVVHLLPQLANWYTYCHNWPTGTPTATTGLLVHLLPQLAYWYTYCHHPAVCCHTGTEARQSIYLYRTRSCPQIIVVLTLALVRKHKAWRQWCVTRRDAERG